MYAIIETGGKQIKVAPGDKIFIEKIEGEVDGEVIFDKVLLFSDTSAKVGAPYVSGVKVTGKIVKQDKAAKIIVFRYRAKHNIRVKKGHRQPYTQVLIESIQG